MDYQSFDNRTASSRSSEKLARLRLPASFKGKRVLDLGCNEGFFCLEAKRRGAARVLGIDKKLKYIAAARERAAAEKLDVEFEVGHFRSAKGEFDYIFFLSAIHYAKNPKAVLRHLSRLLAPGGKLILECGVVGGPGHMMARALRSIDERYFPSLELLVDDWLDAFAVRAVGPSIKQSGDPVGRRVFHCSKRKPTVIFVSGNGSIGKSTIARQFRNPLLISTDATLNPVRHKTRAKISKEQAIMDRALVRHENNIEEAWTSVRSKSAVVHYFAKAVCDIISLNRDRHFVVVEGFMAADLAPLIMDEFKDDILFWSLGQSAQSAKRALYEAGDAAAVGAEGSSPEAISDQQSAATNPKSGLFSSVGTRLRS